jgi:predicted ATPase
MRPPIGGIRTPDQRLRVFVSSTLKELAPERRAARSAIERLAMAPVMFELGARPHPPRDLYRAYLEQSDIFVGLYWQKYGWVAPGEDVSGLEDEYDLAAPDMPKLIYIRDSVDREERLKGLLDRIKNDDMASYTSFDGADELATLITADLAVLLAEHFAAAVVHEQPRYVEPAASSMVIGLPAPLTRLIGREDELDEAVRMLTSGDRLVTITGPGGIGKSRLAIDAARAAEGAFPDGVAFVDLAPVRDPSFVMTAIARALGIRDTGDSPIDEKLNVALRDRRILLLLDNVEQVVEAAPRITALLARSRASVLATSRILLRVGGELSIDLGPLPQEAAVDLFMDRARAVKPDFKPTTENREEIARICTALEGAPLAVELAAARMRVLTPAAIVERLGHSLRLLVGGARDLPERQRTIRGTIEWSTRLLANEERELLIRLGVFRSGFSLNAVEWMAEGIDGVDALGALGSLVDGSLVRQLDRGARAFFGMPATVREYAREELEARGLLAETAERHARFYLAFSTKAGRKLTYAAQNEWMSRLVDERDELRAAVDHFIATRQWNDAAELTWPLYWFWWVGGQLGEVAIWANRILEGDTELSDHARAIALLYVNGLAVLQTGAPIAPELAQVAETFHREGDVSGEAFTLLLLALTQMVTDPPYLDRAEELLRRGLDLVIGIDDSFARALAGIFLGRVALVRGHVAEAVEQFDTSLGVARGIEDGLGEAVALNHIGWARVLSGDLDPAAECFFENLDISTRIGYEEGVAYALEGLFGVAALSGQIERSGRLLGAAEMLRERKGFDTSAQFSFHQPIVASMLAGPAADAFTAALAAGRNLSLPDAVEEAWEKP